MPENKQESRGKIPLKSFLADFKSNVADQELREKYGLSARGFVTLIKTLLARNIINPDDLAVRKDMAVQRDLARESQFLSGLCICPNCSHPHPQPFEFCPACGCPAANTRESHTAHDSVNVTSRHFYISDEDVEEDDLPEEEPVPPESDDISPARSVEPAKDESPEKASGKSMNFGKQFRSLLSKFKK
jgi:hypothetical protein